MKKRKIFKHLKYILTNMGIAEKAITEKASFYKDLGLDSLDFAEMVMEFETTFGVDIPLIDAENIHTVNQAAVYLENRFKA